MLFEFVQELLHLESSRQSLDEARRSDTVLGETQFAGCEVEDIVPKSSLEVVFHLREIEVRAVASLDEFRSVVEKVNGKVEKTAGDGLSIDEDVAFVEVPSSWSEESAMSRLSYVNGLAGSPSEGSCSLPDDEDCGVLAELVLFSVGLEIDLAPVASASPL